MVACLAIAVLWATSWLWPFVVTAGSGTPPQGMSSGVRWRVQFYSMRGGMDVRWYGQQGATGAFGERPRRLSASRLTRPMRLSEMRATPSMWNRLGFGFVSGGGAAAGGTEGMVAFGVPYWFLLGACGVCLLVLWARRSKATKGRGADAAVAPRGPSA